MKTTDSRSQCKLWWDWASDSEYVIPVLVLRELPEVPKLGKGLNWALEEQEEGPCRPAERLLCGQAAVRRSRRVQRPQGVDGRPLHQSADSPAQPHTQAVSRAAGGFRSVASATPFPAGS